MKIQTLLSGSLLSILGILMFLPAFSCSAGGSSVDDEQLDTLLSKSLQDAGFSGLIGQSLENKLGRKVNTDLSETGRLLWFDSATGLNNDNSCGGCHSPSNGLAIPSPLQLELRTMASSVQIGQAHETSAGLLWPSTVLSIPH
jgi:cytochrome c peroxidase